MLNWGHPLQLLHPGIGNVNWLNESSTCVTPAPHFGKKKKKKKKPHNPPKHWKDPSGFVQSVGRMRRWRTLWYMVIPISIGFLWRQDFGFLRSSLTVKLLLRVPSWPPGSVGSSVLLSYQKQSTGDYFWETAGLLKDVLGVMSLAVWR